MSKICFWNTEKGCVDERDATPEEQTDLDNNCPSVAELNRPILAELDRIDAKSIRAIREGDQERIAIWNAQAAELRAKLVKE